MFQNQNQAGLKEASTFDSWRIAGCMSCVSWAPGQVRIGHHVTVHGPVHSRVRGPSAPRPISLGINHGTKDEQAASCRGWGSSSVSRPVGVGDAVHTTYLLCPEGPSAYTYSTGVANRLLYQVPSTLGTHMRTGHRGYSWTHMTWGLVTPTWMGWGTPAPERPMGPKRLWASGPLGCWLLAAGRWLLAPPGPVSRLPGPEVQT